MGVERCAVTFKVLRSQKPQKSIRLKYLTEMSFNEVLVTLLLGICKF